MKSYYDTGVLLKLYMLEPASAAVQRFVESRGQPVWFNDLHDSECVAAIRLKLFRRECTSAQADKALVLIETDVRNGVLRKVAVNWERAWIECRTLVSKHAARTGCRTLDALHVACAQVLGADEFLTSDRRQSALARAAGLSPRDPTV